MVLHLTLRVKPQFQTGRGSRFRVATTWPAVSGVDVWIAKVAKATFAIQTAGRPRRNLDCSFSSPRAQTCNASRYNYPVTAGPASRKERALYDVQECGSWKSFEKRGDALLRPGTHDRSTIELEPHPPQTCPPSDAFSTIYAAVSTIAVTSTPRLKSANAIGYGSSGTFSSGPHAGRGRGGKGADGGHDGARSLERAQGS
jgi:hypothetical protein